MNTKTLFFTAACLLGSLFQTYAQEVKEEIIYATESIAVEEAPSYQVMSVSSVDDKAKLSQRLRYDIDYVSKEQDIFVARKGENYYSYSYALFRYSTEQQITPFIFSSFSTYDSEKDRYIVRIKDNYGVINSKGKFVIPCIYKDLRRERVAGVGFYIAKKGSRSGLLDANNSIEIPFDYESISTEDESRLLLKKNGLYELMDFISKKVYLSGYEYISSYSFRDNEEALFSVKKNGLSNIVNLQGEPRLKVWHESVYREGTYYMIVDNEKYGILDSDGKEVLPQVYDRIEARSDRNDQYSFIVRKDGNYGICDNKGKIVIPIEYQEINRYYSDTIMTVKKNGKYGTMTFDGKPIIPIEYTTITSDDNVYLCSKNDKTGAIDKKGKIVIPFKYNKLFRLKLSNYSLSRSNLYLTLINGKNGIIDNTGKEVVPALYNLPFNDDYNYGSAYLSYPLICSKDGKYGAIDLDNKVVIPFLYDDIQFINSFACTASKTGKYGIIDSSSEKVILPFEYDFIIVDINNNSSVTTFKDGKFETFELFGSKIYKQE